ncbi:MAG: UDP-N-acetylglucosamine--N-acetylmuramyl-(pentapeptide) pyrophosphoryl-undecaprenol N-acetylglucosamine transferase, partial [Treponema sp.]|nr:UDP-N-acetylglucosamine--N-acetylmuramyl-(pentapeptide) pyrophosphoryl-undecaprenol N-acetylglucosamine transferase [Treponema sp.]
SGNSRGDQVENARYFEKAGAAICLTGADLTNDNFIRVITELAGDSRKRLAMAEASQKIGKINGAVRACDVIMEFINNE